MDDQQLDTGDRVSPTAPDPTPVEVQPGEPDFVSAIPGAVKPVYLVGAEPADPGVPEATQ